MKAKEVAELTDKSIRFEMLTTKVTGNTAKFGLVFTKAVEEGHGSRRSRR